MNKGQRVVARRQWFFQAPENNVVVRLANDDGSLQADITTCDLGQEYVKRAFTPEAKQRMQTMVNNLLAAFHDRLVAADWMSEETRKKQVKVIKDRLEQHKVTIRNIRHEALKGLSARGSSGAPGSGAGCP